MDLRSALGKAVASLNNFPLHDGTIPHLRSVLLVDIVMVEGIFLKGSRIGIQATEIILIVPHKDGTEAHPGTKAEGVEVGALLAHQVYIMDVMGIIGGIVHAVLAQGRDDLH